jgi:uncharacterized protein YjbI with pentapeptide repeats
MSKAPLVPAEPDLSHELVSQELPEELRGLDLEGVLLERLDLSDRDASNVQLVKCRLVQLDLSDSAAVGAGFRDVIAVGGSWANIRAERAAFRRVQLRNLRLTGANLAEADIQDATFEDCRIDLASFRFANLKRVGFERCQMDEIDFYEANLSSVAFTDCVLVGATLAGATFTRSEMRGCDLSGVANPGQLRGVRMPWPDVISAAGELAAAVGIEIVD